MRGAQSGFAHMLRHRETKELPCGLAERAQLQAKTLCSDHRWNIAILRGPDLVG